jgi:5-methyltetrahydropteroyltriglutamate--homocysteine methyltransferase
MPSRTTPPFRGDHVGSLLRPQKVLQAREDRAAGRITPDELRAVEDDAIRDVVQMQADVGLRSATDGEFRRTSWHMDFIYRLGGVHVSDERITVQFHNQDGDIEFDTAALVVDGRISLPETIFAHDFRGIIHNLAIEMPSRMAEHRHHDGKTNKIWQGAYEQEAGDDKAPY